jgi:hypothetical protein
MNNNNNPTSTNQANIQKIKDKMVNVTPLNPYDDLNKATKNMN